MKCDKNGRVFIYYNLKQSNENLFIMHTKSLQLLRVKEQKD
jgi:hypothetical protein